MKHNFVLFKIFSTHVIVGVRRLMSTWGLAARCDALDFGKVPDRALEARVVLEERAVKRWHEAPPRHPERGDRVRALVVKSEQRPASVHGGRHGTVVFDGIPEAALKLACIIVPIRR